MPSSMNTSPTRVVMKALIMRRPGRGLGVPETDQQVRAQAHDLPADEQGQQVIGDHQGVHAEGEQADEGKEARVHRLDRRHGVRVTVGVGQRWRRAAADRAGRDRPWAGQSCGSRRCR